MERPFVSISCITYNHAPYIRKCLDSFLMQKTLFSFEILIHDDASTDGTTEIIREYELKYPNLIKPLYEEINQWKLGRRGSSLFNFPRAKGKYIAMCEGDDYWTDPLKLQKQVDIMESNSNYALCFHATYLMSSTDDIKYKVLKKNRNIFTVDDLILGGGGFMATNSMLFLNKLVRNTPKWMTNCPVGDLPLMLLLGTHGKVFYIDEVMSAYRIGTGGYTSTVGMNVGKIKQHYAAIYSMFEGFDLWTKKCYHNIILQRIDMLRKQYYKEIIMCFMKSVFGERTFYRLYKYINKIKCN